MTARTLAHPFSARLPFRRRAGGRVPPGNGLPALAGPWGWIAVRAGRRRRNGSASRPRSSLSLVGLWALFAFVHPAFRILAPPVAVAP